MATVKLDWQELSTEHDGPMYRCEIKARNAADALFMEVHVVAAWLVLAKINASAYYWLEDDQRRIPLYDEEEFGSRDAAKEALTQWYLANAPALLATLAG